MNDIVVHKFGGSCLREKEDIEKVIEAITEIPGRPIVVVSALWGMTDRLFRAAREPRYAGRLVEDLKTQHLRFAPGLDKGDYGDLFAKVIHDMSSELVNLSSGEPSTRSENLILAAGERLSALAIAHQLRKHGLDSHPVGAEDVGLMIKGKGRLAQIDIEKSRISLDRDKLEGIPILTGWFGEGEDGEIALLSRGGSDHSASAFANLLNASKVILWKDVDGIKQLNPRWGIKTNSIPYLGYGEASELSLHGTPVIHPATVAPLIEEGIPLEIRNILNPKGEAPTTIGPDFDSGEVKGIGCQLGVAIVKSSSSIDSELISILEEYDITTWSLISTPEEMKLILSSHDLHHIEHLISGQIEYKTAMISIIGPKELQIKIEHEFVSNTKVGKRITINSDNIGETLSILSQSLFSLQDCR
ncbi:MAG: hypothetical protein QGI21_00095 [Candidatus Poseidoniaceae archaeon]|jgi:aspartate kinase|nr:hypothetical protein [Candidatus Poseidoniaceae archaeon]